LAGANRLLSIAASTSGAPARNQPPQRLLDALAALLERALDPRELGDRLELHRNRHLTVVPSAGPSRTLASAGSRASRNRP
jgi:hypothetical protein